jgi:hypothetical protein
MPASCPACGATLPGAERPIVLGSNDPADLERLFRGDVDTVRCAACGYDTGTDPLIAVGFDAPAAILVAVPPGDTEGAALVDTLREQVGDSGIVEAVRSVTALRDAVTARLLPRLAVVREVLELTAQGDADMSLARPRLTPAVFAVAALGLGRPGHELDLPERTESRLTTDVLAEVQADVWKLASVAWMADPDRATLEDTLSVFVDDSTPLPGAVERLDEQLDEATDDAPWVLHYAHEALRATVHRVAGTPNGRKLDWAQLFMGYEVALCTGRWDADSPLLDQAVSQGRAESTLDLEATWIAAGQALRRALAAGGSDVAREVEAIAEACTKAGHSGLVASLLDGRTIA